MSIGLSEQEIQRRQALQELRKLGIDPYPAEAFEVNVSAKDIKEKYINPPVAKLATPCNTLCVALIFSN